jgi:D-ribulokinase
MGVDVGTGSARAGIFSESGDLLASGQTQITLYQETGDIAEQSSENIWSAVCKVTRETIEASGISPEDVIGIGFDATCSLVAIDLEGRPIGVGSSGDEARNVIVWMDHRATPQARRINATHHEVLSYVGGTISPEMETPKLLWLAENKPDAFAKAGHFFDLPDWLTFRATGSTIRSTWSVTCKWTYLAHQKRWDESYFRSIGLGPLVEEEGGRRIGSEVADPGTAVGDGLTVQSAAELGLRPGTTVGASLIDAHAGGGGSVGARASNGDQSDPRRELDYIFGTSECAMSCSDEPRFVPGVWGPYFSAMVPGLWLNEGGQSAAGFAIEHALKFHPAYNSSCERAVQQGISLYAWLEQQLTQLTDGDPAELAKFGAPLNVVPEFLGNRAPLADPKTRATITGLGLEAGEQGFCRLYLSTLCGVAYGARQIVQTINRAGAEIDTIVLSGGAGRSGLIRQMLADAIGLTVKTPATGEPVLLGSAMLGAVASGAFPSLVDAMRAMSHQGAIFRPTKGHTAAIHSAKYEAFLALQAAAQKTQQAVSAAVTEEGEY